MAAASPDGTVKATKPATSPPAQSVGGAFASTDDFHVALDENLGRGKWKPTGDYRTVQRENQLRAMGAATVAPGHISPHSRGNPTAPGAHDIVIANVTPQEGIRLLQKIPGVKSVRFEGASGTEGAHFHVNMADATGWREGPVPKEDDIDRVQTKSADGWTLEPAPVTTQDIAWRLGPKPKAKPKPTGPSALDKASTRLGHDIDARVAARRHASEAEMEAGEEQIYDPGPDPITGLQNKVSGAFRAVGGAFGYLGSWPGALIDTYPGHAIAEATKNAPSAVAAPPPQPVLKRDQFGVAMPQHDISDAPGHGGVKERPTLAQQAGAFFDPVHNYDARIPETFAGDAALNIASVAIGGKEVATPHDMAKGYEAGEEISHELPPPRPPRRGEPPTATRDWSDLTPAEKRADRAEASRAKRNKKAGIATPQDVRDMQDQHPSPFTHPDPVDGEVDPAEQSVFHGSPHEFDRFDLDKVGTGQGAQSYGHGLYFASRKGVAEQYRDELSRSDGPLFGSLSEEENKAIPGWVRQSIGRVSGPSGAEDVTNVIRHYIDDWKNRIAEAQAKIDSGADIQPWVARGNIEGHVETIAAMEKLAASGKFDNRSPGRLYHVEIPDDDEYLDWDKPLSEQSDHVKAALEAAGYKPRGVADPTGREIYEQISDLHSDERASAHLRKHGIAGNRYLDQGSRAAGHGTHNYVLFDDSRAEIKAREQEALDPREGKVGGGVYTPEEVAAVEKKLSGKEVTDVLDHVIERNPDRPMGLIAKSVKGAVERFTAAGFEFRFRIVNPGAAGADKLSGAYGAEWPGMQGGKPIISIIYRGSKWANNAHGLHDSTLLHESVHAVTQMALHAGREARNAGTDLAQTVASLDRLANHVIKVFNERQAKGENPFHIGAVVDADELLAYGFTHEPFQRWLETIPYASGNAWSDFVDTIRKLLRLPAKQHTALSALIRHGEALFDETNPSEVREGLSDTTSRRDGGEATAGKFGKIAARQDGQRQLIHEEHPIWGPSHTDGGKAPMPKAGGGKGGGGDNKGGYGGSGFGPGDIPEPGSTMHRGPVIGDEPDPITQLDNGLYRVGGAATADKIEAMEFLEKKTPKELSDPAIQAELSSEIEQQIVDPSHQIPDRLKAAYDHFAKWRDEVMNTVNYLRSLRDPTIEPFLPETGYTPRRVQGHVASWDAAVEGPDPKSTDVTANGNLIPNKRNISPSTTSLNSRTAGWMVPDWKTGELVFSREKPDGAIPGTRIATMDEVEANTDTRFYRNPLINTVDEALRLRRVVRAVQVLDHVKKTLKAKGMAFHYEWKDPGGVTRGPGRYKLPDGFVPITNVPQLEGWAFHPEIAEVFRDYYPPEGTELDNALNAINRMMIGTLFITPIPHILNVAAHAWTGRGWDWFDIPGMAKEITKGNPLGALSTVPKAYVNGVTTALQAIREVWTKGPLYREMMREGAGMMYGDTQVRNFLNVMLEKAGHEIVHDPQNFKEFAREFDLKSMGIHTAKDLVRLLYDKSNKSMWMVNDMFLMQRILELQKKGADMRTAIFETEKDIPNYRIPSRVMGSRGMSQFLRNRNVLVFGRYKYGQWKALSGMFRDFVDKSSSMEERVDALGKILVTGLTMMAIFPAADMALKSITGNQDARVRRPGPFAILDAFAQYASGEKDWAVAGSSLASLSPLTMEAVQAWENRDFFGRPLVNAVSPLGVGVQLFEMASEPIYPLKTAEEFAKPGGGTRAVGRMFGLDIPPEGSKQMAAYYRQRDKVSAARREAKDPLQQTIMRAVDKLKGGSTEESAPPPPQEGDEGERPGWTLGPIK